VVNYLIATTENPITTESWIMSTNVTIFVTILAVVACISVVIAIFGAISSRVPVAVSAFLVTCLATVAAVVLLVTNARPAGPLTQDEYVAETVKAGFTVTDPPRAYSVAKVLCMGKNEPTFEADVRNLVALATFDSPKTPGQVDTYVGIVKRTCV